MNNLRAAALLSFMSFCWVGFLFVESTRPPAAFLGLVPQLDKAAHFGAFGILALLLCCLSLALRPKDNIPILSMPFAVIALCGALEEVLQMFIPGRMASVTDLLADMSGAIVAILLVNRLKICGKLRFAAR